LPWRNLRATPTPIEVPSHQLRRSTRPRCDPEEHDEFPDSESRLAESGRPLRAGSNLVRFDRGLIAESIAKAPSEFTLHARNPARNLTMGGNNINFASVASAPNVSDLDRGRRPGSFEDYCNLLRLCQTFNVVQLIGGYPVEPADIPPATRHLMQHYAAITLTDRVGIPIPRQAAHLRCHRMIKIARGFISDEQLHASPHLLHRELDRRGA
jgi:trimethylamine--corrinoid protein Co-methyltransferase